MKILIFRVDSSNIIGSGHVFRCVNLANQFNKKKYNIIFVCKRYEGNFIDYIKKNNFKVIIDSDLYIQKKKKYWPIKEQINDANFFIKQIKKKITKVDLIVIDHYGLGSIWRKKIKPLCKKIFVIDDFHKNSSFCDFYLNHNSLKSKMKIIRNKIILRGVDYLLTGKNLKFKKGTISRKNNIFFYMGSVDSNNITNKFIKFFSSKLFADYKFYIIIGRNNIEAKLITNSTLQNNNIIYMSDKLKNFQSFYQKIGNVFSPVNTTMYEQIKYGFKPIVIPQNNIQFAIGRKLFKEGFINLISLKNLSEKKLKNIIDKNKNFLFKKKFKKNSVEKVAEIIKKNI